MDYRSPLAKVRGLGSAKAGTSHWWMQRISAVSLIPLSFWQLTLLNLCFNAPYQDTVQWLASPLNSAAIIAWVVAAFYHAALGLQVVIEDYVHHQGCKILSIWAVYLGFIFFGLIALIALLRITLAG